MPGAATLGVAVALLPLTHNISALISLPVILGWVVAL